MLYTGCCSPCCPFRYLCLCTYGRSNQDDKDEFYQQLQALLAATPRKDLLLIGGDFNAKVGPPQSSEKPHVGTDTVGERNTNGDILVGFTTINDLILANSTFCKKRHLLYTWRSNDGRTSNQIDFILIPRHWRSSVLNPRATSHNTVLDSDHRMVTASLRLKLKKYTNTTRATRYNVQALHSAGTAQRFNNELTCLLGDLDGSDDINKHWNNIKSSLHTAAEKILG